MDSPLSTIITITYIIDTYGKGLCANYKNVNIEYCSHKDFRANRVTLGIELRFLLPH